ncbi:MAG: thymidine phosphorylase [Bacteroidetes bacterium]|nr:thymidine phosphorylase [Bacteroidota bacterium]
MNVVELIRKKRNGLELASAELRYIIEGYVKGTVPDYQVSSFLMATYFRGMTKDETREFTRLMLHSGDVLDLQSIPGVKVDKHSTGGVGDKISLPLAPIVAACGVPVPMISGRGLGHTGGTLDKLESIPGFRTDLSIEEYKAVIADLGLVMIGQTKEIAPADKKMYALRDVTATVECIPLIAGSIMSKKLAEGIDALVLDVKTGRGAFMQTYERSLELAKALVEIGTGFGKRTVGFITNMDQPLGYAIGNWVETEESIACLHDAGPADVMELTYVLGGMMVVLGGKASTLDEGMARCRAAVQNGSAFEKFVALVQRQGGDVSYIHHPERYPVSRHRETITAPQDGFVTSIDSLELGLSVIGLGGGRTAVDDIIDPKAGILLKKKAGDAVRAGEVIAECRTDNSAALETLTKRIAAAYSFGTEAPKTEPLVLSIVDADGVRPFPLNR